MVTTSRPIMLIAAMAPEQSGRGNAGAYYGVLRGCLKCDT